jgi:hypothetical protein
METIRSVDINFSNGAGGHSATIQTLLGAKNVQNGENVGTVIGDLGEISSFSNDKIAEMLANFVCVEKSTATNATTSAVSRKYIDKTSLILKSHAVLVRGVNCGPREDLDFIGEVPFFSEVINAPIPLTDGQGREFPFPSLDPVKKGSVITAGRIFNYESAAQYDGIKINLVYSNKKLQDGEGETPNLCLNADAVSDLYKGIPIEGGGFVGGPDLAQYDLKFGYTLNDFNKILSLAGIQVDPQNNLQDEEQGDKVLFENSGTLASVVASVASYFGYFWYINPKNGFLSFINTQTAANLKIEDFRNTTDENILSTSFTESLASTKIVNSYIGTSEKKDDESPKDDDRPKRIFFKRYEIAKDFIEVGFGRSKTVGEGLNQTTVDLLDEELGAMFAIFNQNQDAETFNKYFFRVMHSNTDPINKDDKCNRWGMDLDPDGGKRLVYELLYNGGECANHNVWEWGPAPKNADGEIIGGAKGDMTQYIYDGEQQAEDPERRKSTIKRSKKKDDFFDRVRDDFTYIACNNANLEVAAPSKMKRASETDLYTFLSSYFAIAGGIFISNGYSRYKAERMEFTNMNNITVVGPLKGDTLISEIDDLSELNDILELVQTKKRKTVTDIWRATKDLDGKPKTFDVQPVNDFFFIAIRNIPKLERKNGNEEFLVDFKPFQRLEFYESGIKRAYLWLGGTPEDMIQLDEAVSLSYSNYRKATADNRKSLPMEYLRRKTRVNKIGDDPFEEEKEDEDLSEGTSAENKMSELFDRFDFKYFKVDSPDYNLLNNLTLSSFSGSTTEMMALEEIKGDYEEGEANTKSSTRSLYGLHIPEFSPTINSISIRVGGDGITTTVNESTIKLIPPNQTLLTNRAHESALLANGLAPNLGAKQRNALGL